MHVSLAIFNLIPIPPLDGSRIAAWLVPYRYRDTWHAVERLSPFLLMAIFFFGGRLIAGPSRVVIQMLNRLLNAIA
jgi:Zn-dependent protease